jgi:hypothetical protein
MKTQLIYLGFVISSNELKMDPEKLREIIEWPSPRSMFEVRSFHGLASSIESSSKSSVEFVHQ